MKPTNRHYVAGTLSIPVFFPVYMEDEQDALNYAKRILSSKTISVIHGDISTWSGNQYPLIAKRVNIEWLDITDSVV